MINKDKVIELIKLQLPQVDNKTANDMAVNIIQDAEAVIHSMVREEVTQQREHLYRKNNQDA